jgi:hypothetical protein
MNDPFQPQERQSNRGLYILLLCFGLVAAVSLAGVALVKGMFSQSRETAALRQSFSDALRDDVRQKMVFRVGYITTGLVRLGSTFLDLPVEAKAGLRSARAGEVGMFDLPEPLTPSTRARVLTSADSAMRARGWVRLVGVVSGKELVAVYVPERASSGTQVRCCVMVCHDCELILASAKADVGPLLGLANTHLDLPTKVSHLALR